MQGYAQGALRKELLIAPFVESLNNYFEKVSL